VEAEEEALREAEQALQEAGRGVELWRDKVNQLEQQVTANIQ
jgi:hypothetical protein